MNVTELLTVSIIVERNIQYKITKNNYENKYLVDDENIQRIDYSMRKSPYKDFNEEFLERKGVTNKRNFRSKIEMINVKNLLDEWSIINSGILKESNDINITLSTNYIKKYSIFPIYKDFNLSINTENFIIGSMTISGSTINFSVSSINTLYHELNRVLKKLINNKENYIGNTVGIKGKYNLFFDPFVSSIFFHELVGHGLEEGFLKKGDKVGPLNLSVYQACLDDLSVPRTPKYQKQLLIKNGFVIVDKIEIQGHRKSIRHSPSIRLNNLIIDGGFNSKPNFVEKEISYIKCCNVGLAEFYEGYIILEIKNGLLISDSKDYKRIERLILKIHVNEVYKHFKHLYDDYETVRGICTKNNDTLPTVNHSPSILFLDTYVES